MGFLDGTPDPYNEFNGTQRFYDNWYSQKRENQIVAEFQAEIDRLREELSKLKTDHAGTDISREAWKEVVFDAVSEGYMSKEEATQKAQKIYSRILKERFPDSKS